MSTMNRQTGSEPAGQDTAAGQAEDAVTKAAPRNLTPAAQRALAEAEERRRQQSQNEAERAHEIGGRAGPDPVRFGDWEKGGIVSDF
jgi:hypothetical protein